MSRHRQHDEKDTMAVEPWYWRDWRASEGRATLKGSKLAVWCYRELLDMHWSQKDGRLPDDDAALAALADVTLEEWLQVRDQVLRFIPIVSNGRRHNRRAHHEWKKAKKFRAGARERGKAGAKTRWSKEKEELSDDGSAIAQLSETDGNPINLALANHGSPSPSPSPSPPPPPYIPDSYSPVKAGGQGGPVESESHGPAGPNGNGPPARPPAPRLVVEFGITYDPEDRDQAEIVERCGRIATVQGTSGRQVLADMTATPGGAAITDGYLANISPEWKAATRAVCERVEGELIERDDENDEWRGV